MRGEALEQLGRYQLIGKIGTGGMAEVFLARVEGPAGFEKRVVVKRMLPHLAEDEHWVEMFLQEAKLAAALDHPNIVHVFDFGQVDGRFFIAMEFIDGLNVRTLCRRAHERHQSIPEELAAKMVSLACEGLAHVHDLRDPVTGRALGLVHRDVSPENLLVSRSGAVKVVDFGIAKPTALARPTRSSGGPIGKYAYMPPEQLRQLQMDRRVDVFALGMVLYEMLSGRKPFDATSEVSILEAILGPAPLTAIDQIRPGTSPVLAAIVARALAKDRDQRYADCRQLQGALESFMREQGGYVGSQELAQLVQLYDSAGSPGKLQTPLKVVATPKLARPAALRRPGAPPPKPDVPAIRRAGRWGLVIVSLLLVGVGALIGTWMRTRARPAPPSPAPSEPVVAEPSEPVVAAPSEPVVAAPVAPPVAPSEPVAGAGPRPQGPGARRAAKLAAIARLELRIRPYATVFLDGREVGETPLPPLEVTPGRHTLRLVNVKLGKDVSLQVDVGEGEEQVVKLNLRE